MSLVTTEKGVDEAALAKLMQTPVIKTADMVPAENMQEAVEVITMAVDKYGAKNYEGAARMIKETMDKKFGTMWHCAIGEGFGFDITYQQRQMVYVFYGKTGVLLYKC